ncbi:MAG: hypothetical protein QOD63_1853 [Actinomycetota bacterium]|nr:hypothetical protein [Actinomycetota bacterium]
MTAAALLQADVPVPTYRIAFAAAPLDPLAGIAWTDVTTFTPADGFERLRVLSRHSTAGKKDAQTKVDTSHATYVVDNRDGAFNPINTASPYWPNVKLNVILQELATWAGVTYAVFTGFVDDYDIQSDELGRPVVAITCSDAQKILNLDALDASVWKIEVRKDVSANIAAGNKTAWLRLNDANSSEVATDYSGQGWDGTYQNGPVLGQKSIIAGDTDSCMDVAHTADQRASLPYKHLVTQFPFTVEVVFRCDQKRNEVRGIVYAYDGPVAPVTQAIRIYVDFDFAGRYPGQIGASITNGGATLLAHSSIVVDDFVTHHLAVVFASSTSVRIWIDGSDFTVPVTAGPVAVPDNLLTGYAIANTPAVTTGDFGFDAGVTVDPVTGNDITGGIQSVVFYDGVALSPARIQKHAQAAITGWGTVTSGSRVDQLLDTIGWPVADRAVDAGSSSISNIVSGGTPLAYLQLLAETEGGRFFVDPGGLPTFHGRTRPILNTRSVNPQAIFDDAGSGGSIPYIAPFEPHLDDIDLTYRASVARVNGPPQIYDATPGSTATRTLTKSGLLMTGDVEARSMAQYLVSVGKLQGSRIRTLSFAPQASPTLGWPAALGLRQGDRVTVRRHFEDGTIWIADWIVEGIDHAAEGAATFETCQLALSPADPAHYFILGSSALGGSDVLFY